jgi:hypothetical protein
LIACAFVFAGARWWDDRTAMAELDADDALTLAHLRGAPDQESVKKLRHVRRSRKNPCGAQSLIPYLHPSCNAARPRGTLPIEFDSCV